jgi:hypothetical protein
MVGGRKLKRGWHQQFVGVRVNCEMIPQLPVWVVRWVLDDPRRIPYLLMWTNPRTGDVQDAVRVMRTLDPRFAGTDYVVEVKRPDGSLQILRAIWRGFSRNRARDLLLACPGCQKARRALYGSEAAGQSHCVRRCDWQCRTCAGLSYASEGGALEIRSGGSLGRWLGQQFGSHSPRPDPWLPLVFTSPSQAAELGLATLQ